MHIKTAFLMQALRLKTGFLMNIIWVSEYIHTIASESKPILCIKCPLMSIYEMGYDYTPLQ